MKDLLYYLLAAGCSIGMAVCLVLESSRFLVGTLQGVLLLVPIAEIDDE